MALRTEKQTKPLLKWMDEGDPDRVPVMMADGRSTAAAYFGVPVRRAGSSASFTGGAQSPVTPQMILQCSKETGIHVHGNLGYATAFDAVPFLPDVETSVEEILGPDGSVRKSTTICTPAGRMSEVFVTPPDRPAYWETHLVKTERDLPALCYLIEHCGRAFVEDPRVREKVKGRFQAEADRWADQVPLHATAAVPAFGLTCNLYMDSTAAFYLLADHADLMEGLFEIEAQRNAAVIAWSAEAGADFILGAINGLELYSPAIYQRYFIPQARALHAAAHAVGLRGWVHTCGHMGRLIEMGAYDDMDVDVLESLSHPPLGDLKNLGQARAKLGSHIVTRGAVNVSLFYEPNVEQIRERARHVLEQTRGYRHMIGDTNDSFPPYPRENILVLVDEVQKSGRMFPV